MSIQLKAVKPLPHYNLWLQFSDGVEGTIDLSDLVGQGVFVLWTDEREFLKARAARSAVIWNDEVDVDAVPLYLQLTGKKIEDVMPKLSELHHA
jgi:hypothetical protein